MFRLPSPILTAQEMRDAEAAAIGAGTSVETLMERAGQAAAEAIWRYAGARRALILCGPGNNGGDGYVIARALKAKGLDVRVAALAPPASAAAKWAAGLWDGPTGTLADAQPAPLLVDALFGTGLTRPLSEEACAALSRLAEAAAVRAAIDLPSGASTDDGALLSPVPDFHLTVTFATLKPSHLLQPAAAAMGRLVVADIGIEAQSDLAAIGRPSLAAPGPQDHKYTRGYVAVVAGAMPGATALAAAAALKAGAGYVRLFAPSLVAGVPSAIVQTPGEPFTADPRIGVLAIGPGLGSGDLAARMFEAALASGKPLVIDADALAFIDEPALHRMRRGGETPILTPHEGEFVRQFGRLGGSKIDRARAAAARAQAVIVYKGADTVVAAPDGRAAILPAVSSWLASAGTGDVLTGIVAARRAAGAEAFEAACEAVWLHGRAAALAGPGLIADDLPAHLPAALAECL